jgi:hypothetical protein
MAQPPSPHASSGAYLDESLVSISTDLTKKHMMTEASLGIMQSCTDSTIDTYDRTIQKRPFHLGET